jgi:hypothetical protein
MMAKAEEEYIEVRMRIVDLIDTLMELGDTIGQSKKITFADLIDSINLHDVDIRIEGGE